MGREGETRREPEGKEGGGGAFFLIDRVLSLRSRKGKKGAVGGPFGSLGVIFGEAIEGRNGGGRVKGADGVLSLGGKVERGGSRKGKKGVEGFSS